MTKPSGAKAQTLSPPSADPRRGRLVVYHRQEATPAARAKAKAKAKDEKEPVPLAVYHLTERTTPGGPERVQVEKDGSQESYIVQLGDKLQYWVFDQLNEHSLVIELQCCDPEPRTVATRANTYGHFHNEVLSGMLYLFMRLVPREA